MPSQPGDPLPIFWGNVRLLDHDPGHGCGGEPAIAGSPPQPSRDPGVKITVAAVLSAAIFAVPAHGNHGACPRQPRSLNPSPSEALRSWQCLQQQPPGRNPSHSAGGAAVLAASSRGEATEGRSPSVTRGVPGGIIPPGKEEWPPRALAVAESRPRGPAGRVGAGLRSPGLPRDEARLSR
jgi:hypothetical protein